MATITAPSPSSPAAARLPSPSPHHKSTPESLKIDLDRLLARLEQQLLNSSSSEDNNSNALLHSSYQRSRVGANIEYARTLLLRLDHASASIKTGTRKTATQDTLKEKRELIKRLNQRLHELNQLYDDDEEEDDSSEEEEEDDDQENGGVREFAPAQKTNAGLDYDPLTTAGIRGFPSVEEDVSAAAAASSSTPTQQQEGLRARNTPNMKTANRQQPSSATTTALFGNNRTNKDPSLQSQSTTTTAQILESADSENNLLTTSLIALASSLKSSSLSFQESLAAEKEVLRRAELGLEKNETGMESAGRRMGTLRRMTEGQGWWGRIKLYAIIAALWVACFLIVFVGPKLRF